jgi:hypothetical protein
MNVSIFLYGVLALAVSLSAPSERATLRSFVLFDLDTGSQFSTNATGVNYDLLFGCSANGNEFLRVLNGASWANSLTNNFALGLDVMRQATYSAPINQFSGYPDLFYGYGRSIEDQIGKVYYVRTAEGSLAKIRISAFRTVDANPRVCRNLEIEYELFVPDEQTTDITLPGDRIIGFRTVSIERHPVNSWDWLCKLEVEYTYNPRHQRVEVGGYAQGGQFESGHSLWATGQEVPQGQLRKGIQRVGIAIRLTQPQAESQQLLLYLYEGNPPNRRIVSRIFPFHHVFYRP